MIGLLVLYVCGAAAQPTYNITVGSWNIEHLGNAESRSGIKKGIAQSPEDIALMIRESRVDVLALQEIYDTDWSPECRTNATLDRAFSILNKKQGAIEGEKWRYVMLPNRDYKDTSQLVAMAWNEKTVKMVGSPLRLTINQPAGDATNYFDRHPSAVKFARTGQNKTDFVIIPVHLKATYGAPVQDTNQRIKESELLLAQIAAVKNHFSDRDIIVIGDFNTLKTDEKTIKNFLDNGFKDVGNNQATHGNNAFDRAFVTTDQSPEFANSQMSVFTPQGIANTDYLKRFSDHRMIRFLVQITNDDDQ